MLKNILKKGFFTIGILVFAFGIPASIYVVNNIEDLDDRSQAGSTELLEQVTYHVYPKSGDCEKNEFQYNTNCFEKGIGIQKAIDKIPSGGRILIHKGLYTRNSDRVKEFHFTIHNKNRYYKCFAIAEHKDIDIIGENRKGVIIKGEALHPLNGLCFKGGNISITNLTVTSFKDDTDCDRTQPPGCGIGVGIIIAENTNINLTNNTITHNDQSGLSTYNNAKSTIIGNTISDMYVQENSETVIINNIITGPHTYEGINLENCKNTKIINNTIINKKPHGGRPGGISIYRNCDVIIKNNIIAFNDSTGIFRNNEGSAKHTGSINSSFNNVYGNQNQNWKGLPKGPNSISQDPRLINNNDDFHLQSASPCVKTGDPQIKNPDKSRSNMGAYGGPHACTLDPNLQGCTNGVKGYQDHPEECLVKGWACDASNYAEPLHVQVLNKEGDMIANAVADKTREKAVGRECGGNRNHGFEIPIKSDNAGPLEVKAININKNGNSIGRKINLNGNPKNVSCDYTPTCEDKCGDGVCQEVVCAAIGCPCAENPESCPEDCASDSCIKGDLDCNSSINMKDYSLFVEDYLNYNREEIYQQRSDLNNDNKINMSDYTMFVNIYLKENS